MPRRFLEGRSTNARPERSTPSPAGINTATRSRPPPAAGACSFSSPQPDVLPSSRRKPVGGECQHFRGEKSPVFAHESERELAELLDEKGVPGDYEPHTFPLEHDEDGASSRRSRPTSTSPTRGSTSSARR